MLFSGTSPGGGRSLPLVVYSFLYAIVTTVFLLALARRYVLLYGEGAEEVPREAAGGGPPRRKPRAKTASKRLSEG